MDASDRRIYASYATAFTGVLGALLAEMAMLPLNRTFPVTRTRLMFQPLACRSIIVDAESFAPAGCPAGRG